MPPLVVKYIVPEDVPGIRMHEQLDDLEFLLDKSTDFFDILQLDPAILERLKQGLNKEVQGADKAGVQPVITALEAVSEADRTIEAALINRIEFAAHQLGRFVICKMYIMPADKKERQDLLCEAYNELTESMELLEEWGSHDD
jgi:hypothetical protein